ncbi:hypothetical protein QCA50_000261 [Cerrena zonata]|uniref:Uncharacterized protein n=1 Tax=Cerrena zonata TaxID=2478898 RepID=A0AAW0GQW6_9APHY
MSYLPAIYPPVLEPYASSLPPTDYCSNFPIAPSTFTNDRSEVQVVDLNSENYNPLNSKYTRTLEQKDIPTTKAEKHTETRASESNGHLALELSSVTDAPSPVVPCHDSGNSDVGLIGPLSSMDVAEDCQSTEPTIASSTPDDALETTRCVQHSVEPNELSRTNISAAPNCMTGSFLTQQMDNTIRDNTVLEHTNPLLPSLAPEPEFLTELEHRSSSAILPTADAAPTNDSAAHSQLDDAIDLHERLTHLSDAADKLSMEQILVTTVDSDESTISVVTTVALRETSLDPVSNSYRLRDTLDILADGNAAPQDSKDTSPESCQELNDGYVSPTPTYSSLPSSSPPMLFSSSPPFKDNVTPPSSSPPAVTQDKDTIGDELLQEKTLPDETTAASRFLQQAGVQFNLEVEVEEPVDDTMLTDPQKILSGPFNPSHDTQLSTRKPTFASQKKQHKKLAKPFRSPIISNNSPLLSGHGVYVKEKTDALSPINVPTQDIDVLSVTSSQSLKDYTPKTAKQFKSPLAQTESTITISPSASTTPAESSMYPSLSIQALQGKVQKLRQAIKIKQDGKGEEDDHLSILISKWRIAGREVAWEVWDSVKDAERVEVGMGNPFKGGWDQDDALTMGAKRERGGWGFEDDRSAKRPRVEEGSCDADMQVDEENKVAPQHTLGTMLRFMGIAPETLGWDEDEGDFVGEP